MGEQTAPLKSLFTDIANAIREADGTTELIPHASDFPSRILDIGAKTKDLCTVTVLAGAGGSASGGGVVQKGMTIQVSAAAAGKWNAFSLWSNEYGPLTDTNPLIIRIDRDMTLTAEFETIPHHVITVLANPPEGGTVSGGGEYALGQSATLTATPNEGYYFRSWLNENGDPLYSKNPYTLTPAQLANAGPNVTYIAQFVEIPKE